MRLDHGLINEKFSIFSSTVSSTAKYSACLLLVVRILLFIAVLVPALHPGVHLLEVAEVGAGDLLRQLVKSLVPVLVEVILPLLPHLRSQPLLLLTGVRILPQIGMIIKKAF